MPKNFTRIHARYSKDGMATKLLLKDFRVLGVSHSTTVWFYNIRGVFQVVFEYQEKSVQRDCLSKLKDIWLCRYHDDNLPDSLSVTLNIHVLHNNPSSVVQEDHKLLPNMGSEHSHRLDEEQELFPLTDGEVVIELVKHNRNSCSGLHSRDENTIPDNSVAKHDQINGNLLLDNVVNGLHTTNTQENTNVTVGQTPLATNNVLSHDSKSEDNIQVLEGKELLTADKVHPCNSFKTREEGAQEIGGQNRLVDDSVHLCHSCGLINCPSFQSTVNEDGETIWGTCQTSGLERSLLHKPLCCSKATQIDTVPRTVTKVSVGVQTDQYVSIVQDYLKTNSKAATLRNSSPQTDITMETLAVLTPSCLFCTKDGTKFHGKCSKTNCQEKPYSKQCSRTDVMKECVRVLETLIKYLVQMQPDYHNLDLFPVVKRFRIVLQLLMQEIHLEENQGFPFQLIQEYLDMLGTGGSTHNAYDTWGNSSQRNTFLHIVSQWLGQEFHKFEPKISQRVEDFKQGHINCIDNLPPAESIIDLVFPSCMKELVVSWTSRASPRGHRGSDHDYSPPVKKICTSDSSSPAYPLVQHILEFANHALVSGVAHVVYSRLRHST
ncbi:uncharacterized protein LOC110464093 isoform X2 [Mizuhopecten yessoensis]|nr:uncharacterized protein LOC110464093 isoform X2 [Mizuhopecten yessoensis]